LGHPLVAASGGQGIRTCLAKAELTQTVPQHMEARSEGRIWGVGKMTNFYYAVRHAVMMAILIVINWRRFV